MGSPPAAAVVVLAAPHAPADAAPNAAGRPAETRATATTAAAARIAVVVVVAIAAWRAHCDCLVAAQRACNRGRVLAAGVAFSTPPTEPTQRRRRTSGASVVTGLRRGGWVARCPRSGPRWLGGRSAFHQVRKRSGELDNAFREHEPTEREKP